VGGEIATSDDSDTGYRLFGGYLFSPIQGIVTSYVDLGTANYDGPAFGGFTDALSATGFDVSYLIGFAPGTQERVTVFSTIGFFTWKQDVHYVDSSGTYDYKDSGTSLSYGLGSEINLSAGAGSEWGLHFEWQRFTNVGDNGNSGHEYDRDLLSAGVDYRFGR
jgi:OOP family OmpA-OmpF porin